MKRKKNDKNDLEENMKIDTFFKKNMRRVFWLFFLMFFVLGAYFLKIVILDSPDIMINPSNKRMQRSDQNVRRGSILDIKGNILAESKLTDEGDYFREYPYGKVLSHFIGYPVLGKSGIESKFNFPLQTIHLELFQRFKNLALDEEMIANNVVTTVDGDFSKFIRETLKEQIGSVVVMEPSTGKILSMISYPNFNPETIEKDWDSVKNDGCSPLLNRASQGLYIPGSTFKIVTTVAALNAIDNVNDIYYECRGEAVFGEKRIRCYNQKAHGMVDLKSAFAASCNVFYGYLGTLIDPSAMREAASSLLIDQPIGLDLDYSLGSFTLEDDATNSELVETAIGQGKTLASPLNMAMVASAIANNGLMMKPYVVDRFETQGGTVIRKHLPSSLSQGIPGDQAEMLKNLMVECVVSGTGNPASIQGISVAGKTGTAENPAGDDHSWFIGFAPADQPEIAFSILLENSGGGGKSLNVARKILEYYFTQ